MREQTTAAAAAAGKLLEELASARAELARERALRAEIEEAGRLKDQFLASLSHELRAPLTTMLLWEKVLRDAGTETGLRAKALDAIHQSALRQSHLIGDLLDVSRAIRGKLRVDRRRVDLEVVLRDALRAIEPAARAKLIAISHRGALAPGELLGDASRLRQVLDNLLDNAVKFTPVSGHIEVVLEHEEHAVRISVADSGRGLTAEAIRHLFEPFTQLADPASGRDSGLGLGLAISKQLVALHGGSLTAVSEGPGHGATFTVKLPFSTHSDARPCLSAAQRLPLAYTRILVVDGDRRVREALALLLGRSGALVDTAESVAEALSKIAVQSPDALLCDIAIRSEDGNRFIRRLRDSGQNIPAIALTSHALEYQGTCALAAGFDLHLPKPLDLENLVETIAALVAVRRTHDEPEIAWPDTGSSEALSASPIA